MGVVFAGPPVTPALGKLKQEPQEFKASLGYIVTLKSGWTTTTKFNTIKIPTSLSLKKSTYISEKKREAEKKIDFQVIFFFPKVY